jgi:hypothetical protein
VNRGEYIAIRTARTGTLYCSGGSGVLLFSPPLAPGGVYRDPDDSTSCSLHLQLQYK